MPSKHFTWSLSIDQALTSRYADYVITMNLTMETHVKALSPGWIREGIGKM
jgi:hypothetical protein